MPRIETNEGFQERADALCREEFFHVYIEHELGHYLTTEEARRSELKLNLVAEYAIQLAIAMVRGTLKYPHDDRTPEEWMIEEEQEDVDKVNYGILRRDAISRLWDH